MNVTQNEKLITYCNILMSQSQTLTKIVNRAQQPHLNGFGLFFSTFWHQQDQRSVFGVPCCQLPEKI